MVRPMAPILTRTACSALIDPSRHGFRDAQRDVTAPAVAAVFLSVNQNARFIHEYAAYGAFVELPQFRQFARRVVMLESCAIDRHTMLVSYLSLAPRSNFRPRIRQHLSQGQPASPEQRIP